RNELDITEEKTCEQYLLAQSPDVLINAAAWTAVDRAESNPATVLQVNQDAVQTLARLCQKFGIRLVQYSTDYVFNGLNEAPYKEDDLPDPVN
ncbi:MAG: sugar nucleotide-binding protein, partial [Phycisphaerae bacterium]|nr:sugar nucleotide-binding protein [Phycisphaerae bacterium]NIW46866.1 sugar nucleotide-binding protein [Gammaproteobacteria bacterium]NIP53302.1 sugar nucleotide-binding protein [Phycisphaerae bacterium]NIU09862.1 sugar nucleotide-binding protein [Phycisphaerae bacterium]NIW99639.1 sugar nucleotide-binding protein [Phycisphaerae bacterium]